jgi:CheY-like chemotaxis protein
MARIALVVDDSMLIRHTVCRFLEERGYEVESASNGHEALEALEALRPNIIITDLHMPTMDGHALIAALRQAPLTRDTAVIVLAGKHRITGHAVAGANQVIVKDIDIIQQLESALEATLGPEAA